MDAILAVFRSRPQAYACVEKLKRYGVNASAVSTPRRRTSAVAYPPFSRGGVCRARSVVAAGGWPSFAGYFRVVVRGGSSFVVRA